MGAGNPARRCRLSFSKIQEQFLNFILLWSFFCVKLERKLIVIKLNASTIDLCKKTAQLTSKLARKSLFTSVENEIFLKSLTWLRPRCKQFEYI